MRLEKLIKLVKDKNADAALLLNESNMHYASRLFAQRRCGIDNCIGRRLSPCGFEIH